jgi:quinol monooxygenase YgiN
MSEQITVIARFKTKPETAAQFTALGLNLVQLTRQEDGCLNYDFHQDTEDETLFFMYENWLNAAALAKHFEQSYIREALAAAPKILAEPIELRQLKMISSKA